MNRIRDPNITMPSETLISDGIDRISTPLTIYSYRKLSYC
ncbi:hypothetical protein NEIFLAOT_01909 [Neisseria flavescens NRL30031/H210]|uniref:Uncharacterized protein n=1 Tax=Neisseria flavescens NRL30031/H210 TaxID=546264 RepID=C0EPL9_NEIFL|nr:hypothetical protein NEIFLAOT_01909 [Neisseria flavescens NRL30031/H210]